MIVATRNQVLELLDSGLDYEAAGRALQVPAGQAFLIATGVPADGSDTITARESVDKPLLAGSAQELVNPSAFNPTRKESVLTWVGERARRESCRRP